MFLLDPNIVVPAGLLNGWKPAFWPCTCHSSRSAPRVLGVLLIKTSCQSGAVWYNRTLDLLEHAADRALRFAGSALLLTHAALEVRVVFFIGSSFEELYSINKSKTDVEKTRANPTV